MTAAPLPSDEQSIRAAEARLHQFWQFLCFVAVAKAAVIFAAAAGAIAIAVRFAL